MQFKIPQEINVEDKVFGPFTIKAFGFVFGYFALVAFFVVILSSAGLSLFTAIFIGGVLASPAIIIGFFPYNGKPAYTYAGHFVAFLFKPRKRVWKKYVKPVKTLPENEEKPVEPVQLAPEKESLQDAEGKIEELSLLVDTGGAYSSMQKKLPSEEPETFMDKSNVTVERALQETSQKVEPTDKEPAISDLASVDPNKKFRYEQPDTRDYKLGNVLNKNKEQ